MTDLFVGTERSRLPVLTAVEMGAVAIDRHATDGASDDDRRRPPPSIPRRSTRCLAVLGHRPSAVVTDIDGTISAIAPTPGRGRRHRRRARDALIALADRLALVGVVTGRAAAVGGSDGGGAGARLRRQSRHGTGPQGRRLGTIRSALAKADAIGAALREIGVAAAARGAGRRGGDRGQAALRVGPLPARPRSRSRRAISCSGSPTRRRQRHDLLVTEGRQIVELRPRVVVNKGTAIRALVEEFGLHGLIFLGDDLTDVDAFRAVRELREEGKVAGLRVGVLAAETQPAGLRRKRRHRQRRERLRRPAGRHRRRVRPG